MTAREVSIDVNAAGRGVLKIDGQDVSQLVSRVSFDLAAGNAAKVTLELRALALQVNVATEKLEIIRELLIDQNDCICTEVLPTMGHLGGLNLDRSCPQHGKLA